MKKHSLSFRQIHLDFHTSEHISGIGEQFDKKSFQTTLQNARVSSATTFACCHHGWSYHPTQVNQQHPHLKFNLLREQLDAAHQIGIKMPIYLTAGVHNVASRTHPEWREIGADGQYLGWTKKILEPGFHFMCFNTPYLDYLCAQIEEVMEMFPDGDGIFLDIIVQGQCCCNWCLASMEKAGLDPEIEADRRQHSEIVLRRYYEATTAAVAKHNSDKPIFHNSGHIYKNRPEIIKYFSHLELESLPTGGWGYDHFPLSAKFCSTLDRDFLGMTGKFHLSWGEFGGFKHPNALRYECAAMLAFGSKCSVGDQLHPNGKLDASTYRIIGEAYCEVESKEPWCEDTLNVADIAILSHESYQRSVSEVLDDEVDSGTARLLLESHYLFDVIDEHQDFLAYKALIIPDKFRIETALKEKIDQYLRANRKLIISGESGLDADKKGFLFDLGVEYSGVSPYNPDYIRPAAENAPDFVSQPFVVYESSQRIKATTGTPIGDIHDPYFNREHRHFCSHRHAPNRPDPSGFHAGVRGRNILYFAHPIFTAYHRTGAVVYKEFIKNSIDAFLGDDISFTSNLPSAARISLRFQPLKLRYILHLLYAPVIKRGSPHNSEAAGTRTNVELIEDLPPLVNIEVRVRVSEQIKRVVLQPEGRTIAFDQSDEFVTIHLAQFSCHQMVILDF